MRVWLEGSKTKTKNSRNAGTKKRIWPRRVITSSTKFQFPSSKLQRNPKVQIPTNASPQELGAWCLDILWCLVFGGWSFSKSLSRQVHFLLCPVFGRAWQVELAGQNFSAHLVKHGGLLGLVTRVRRRNQHGRRGQHLQHSRRQRVVCKFRRVAAHGKIAQFGKLALIFLREQQFEELDRSLGVFCARVDEKTGAHSRHRVHFASRRGHGENAEGEL